MGWVDEVISGITGTTGGNPACRKYFMKRGMITQAMLAAFLFVTISLSFILSFFNDLLGFLMLFVPIIGAMIWSRNRQRKCPEGQILKAKYSGWFSLSPDHYVCKKCGLFKTTDFDE